MIPRQALACLCALPFLAPEAAWGQAQGSLAIGAGTVRYPGGVTTSSVTFAPEIRVDAPNATLSIGGLVASLPLGVWSSQGRGDVWVATPRLRGGPQLAVEGIGSGTTRSDRGWTAGARGILEAVWAGRGGGVAIGAGPSSGWISGEAGVTAFASRLRAWRRFGRVTSIVSAEPTRFLGAWFTDLSAGVTVTSGVIGASVWGLGRLSTSYASKGAASAQVRVFPTPQVALELGGGSYLPDPYQGLPRGGFVTAAVRVFTQRQRAPRPAGPALPVLMPERVGDSVVVRFRMPGARSVAIGGDWDDWRPHSLRLTAERVWRGSLALKPGTYHFNLLVDGKDWVVPGGVAIVSDGLGGLVGLLLVR